MRKSPTPPPAPGDAVADWLVLSREPGSRKALCRCSCGTEKLVEVYTLGKDSLSCGHDRRARVHDGSKDCTRCGLPKPVGDFHKDASTPSGLRAWCKDCASDYHEENKDARNARMRELYALDPAAKIAKTSAYRREHPEHGLIRARLERGGGRWVGDITPDGLDSLLARYDHACYICGTPFDESNRVHWDHYQPVARGGDHSLSNLRPSCRLCNVMKNATWPFTEDHRARIAAARRAGLAASRGGGEP